MKLSRTLAFCAAIMLPSASFAAGAPQAGALPGGSVCAPKGVSMKLGKVEGSVFVSRDGGYQQISTGAGLVDGDRILLKDGRAQLVMGAQHAELLPDSLVTVFGHDGATCMQQASANPAVVGADLPPRQVEAETVGGLNTGVLVGAGAAAAGAIALVALSHHGHETVSP